jgi:groucho
MLKEVDVEKTNDRISFLFKFFQQQIHAQQIPGAPPQPMPSLGALGPLGAFAGPMGLPGHGPQSLLKNPQDLHREDIKPLAGPSAEERLVSEI